MAPRLGTKKRKAVSHVTRRQGAGREGEPACPPASLPSCESNFHRFSRKTELARLNPSANQRGEDWNLLPATSSSEVRDPETGSQICPSHFLKAELPSGRGAGWPGMMDVVTQPIPGEGSAGCSEEGWLIYLHFSELAHSCTSSERHTSVDG